LMAELGYRQDQIDALISERIVTVN
jgi:hypothetical protein